MEILLLLINLLTVFIIKYKDTYNFIEICISVSKFFSMKCSACSHSCSYSQDLTQTSIVRFDSTSISIVELDYLYREADVR